jgi:hypothetical protein
MSNFTKICPVGTEWDQADRLTDKMTMLIVAFRIFAKAVKNSVLV